MKSREYWLTDWLTDVSCFSIAQKHATWFSQTKQKKEFDKCVLLVTERRS